jgi:hypothetical protein
VSGYIALLGGKLSQQVTVETPVAGNTIQALCKINPCDFWENDFVGRFYGGE